MRTIKFRGKTCKDDIWVYGQYLESNISWHNRKPHKEWIVSSTMSNGGYIALLQRYPVQEETVGQFTGLYDYNEKEIYEGDILRYIHWENNKEVLCYITFEEEMGSFVLQKPILKRKINITQIQIYAAGLKIIGNIHDNPELLKGE